MVRRALIITSTMSDVNGNVSVPMVCLSAINRSFATAALLKSSDEYAALRDLGEESAR